MWRALMLDRQACRPQQLTAHLQADVPDLAQPAGADAEQEGAHKAVEKGRVHRLLVHCCGDRRRARRRRALLPCVLGREAGRSEKVCRRHLERPPNAANAHAQTCSLNAARVRREVEARSPPGRAVGARARRWPRQARLGPARAALRASRAAMAAARAIGEGCVVLGVARSDASRVSSSLQCERARVRAA